LVIDTLRWNRGLALLCSRKLAADELRFLRREFLASPALSRIREAIEVGERFASIESFLALAQQRLIGEDIESIGGDGERDRDVRRDALGRLLLAPAVDWDEVLRLVDGWFDRAVNALDEPTFQERRAAAKGPAAEFKELTSQASQPLRIEGAGLTKKGRARALATVLTGLLPPSLAFGGLGRIAMRFEIAAALADVVHVAIALEL
jgi:hypothetical protein